MSCSSTSHSRRSSVAYSAGNDWPFGRTSSRSSWRRRRSTKAWHSAHVTLVDGSAMMAIFCFVMKYSSRWCSSASILESAGSPRKQKGNGPVARQLMHASAPMALIGDKSIRICDLVIRGSVDNFWRFATQVLVEILGDDYY